MEFGSCHHSSFVRANQRCSGGCAVSSGQLQQPQLNSGWILTVSRSLEEEFQVEVLTPCRCQLSTATSQTQTLSRVFWRLMQVKLLHRQVQKSLWWWNRDRGQLDAPFASLDEVDLKEVFSRRATVMRSVPMVIRGAYRNAMRVALEEVARGIQEHSDLRTTRGWKLFLLLPRLLLWRPVRGGIGAEERVGVAVQIVPVRPVARVVEHKCQRKRQDPSEICAEVTKPARRHPREKGNPGSVTCQFGRVVSRKTSP